MKLSATATDAKEMTRPQDPAAVTARDARLDDYRNDVTSLDERAFAERHGWAFLLHHGEIGSLRPARRGQATLVSDAGGDAAAAIRAEFRVLPIRATGRSTFPGFVSIGRTANNDIVVNDVSISKFHAFCRVDDRGEVSIFDAGSKNGTFVNDVTVPKQGEGEPARPAAGDTVRLGDVRFSFLSAAAFRDLVLQLVPEVSR
jgi:hypothetical protein